MRNFDSCRIPLVVFTTTLAVLMSFANGRANGQDARPPQTAGIHGGLAVQLGASDTKAAAELSLTGRYLIHVLDLNADLIAKAQNQLRTNGRYGLAWAERPASATRLPYAENMVNLIVVRDYTVPVAELFRVLTPDGAIVVMNSKLLQRDSLEAAGFTKISRSESTLVARKPWPKEMDVWSHPRHAADGNAVSRDTLVGPPDRVRWVAAATSEVEGMVTAGGRNFYGGILARDSFNGLRLWHRNLKNGENNSADFQLPILARDAARPIASDRMLFAVLQNHPVALDAKSGEVVAEFSGMESPTAVIHDGDRVIAADSGSVRAFDVESGKQIWSIPAIDPKNVIADGKTVSFIQGRTRRGDKAEAVALDPKTGSVKWRFDNYPWISSTTRTVLAKGQLVFEVSSLNDHDAGNGIHVVSAETGKHRWSKDYAPGMNHRRQARAMFVEDDLWILHGGKINTDDKKKSVRQPVQVSALDPLTGETRVTFPAGLTHCFPPVATPNFMFAGELDVTNLKSGEIIANRITKANCSQENGWVPANGLVYTTPKHCTCWPMLRGFVAMAPAVGTESPTKLPPEQIDYLLEMGPAQPAPNAEISKPTDWPLYRSDRWRSGSTAAEGPSSLGESWRIALNVNSIFSTQAESATELAAKPNGPILHDWKDN
ncbi:MAG: outer membrane protein assembly factor BamB, partial [Pirellulaceae bacterium]